MLKLEQVKLALSEKHQYTYDEKEYSCKGSSLIREESNFEYEGHKFNFEEQRGGEGQGDDYWIVFSVTSLAVAGEVFYYKVPGWYQSHNGAELEWDNVFEVKSVEKTVTVWEDVK